MTRISLSQDLPQRLSIVEASEHTAALIFHSFEHAPKPVRPMTKHLASASGKGVRTSLLLTSAMDEAGLVPKEAILAAAAVEIFHLATLVHDDVIDDASSRRGIDSVHVKFSRKEAVICGDYLLCMAVSAISTIYEPYKDLANKFTDAVERVCLGELRQYSNNYNTAIRFYEYLRIIRGKTAALFYISAYAGALIGGCPEKDIVQMGRLGTYIGMIFQIIDDCKDYMLDERDALKPTKTDIASGVVNLPLLMAFLKEPALREAAKSTMGNPLKVNGLIHDVHRLDGVGSSLAIVGSYHKKANNILKSIHCKKKSEALEKLLSDQLLIAKTFTDK